MSETKVLMLGALTWLGAWLGVVNSDAMSVGYGVLALLFLAAGWSLVVARPALLLVSMTVLALALGARAGALFEPMRAEPFNGEARLITDPKPTDLGWQAEVKLETGEHVLASVPISVSFDGRAVEAGMQLDVSGVVRPMQASGWSRSRHLVGRLSIDEIFQTREATYFLRPSNWFRSAVRAGSAHVDEAHQDLYLGLVIGDDRFQGSAQRATFRAIGLSHLLAVSGQNVAFVLAVCAPMLRRVGVVGRVVGTLLILIVFAVATRLEPSVMRATATAMLSVSAVSLGRASTGIRTLSLAVTALIIVDPFLVYSVGFSLSVAASLGILILGPVIEGRIPGPSAFSNAAAVTVSAQLGVAPLLMLWFGPISLVSVPANLLVGWAAGLVMTLGLTAGMVAGLLPDTIGMVLQWPTSTFLWWIDSVASYAVQLPVARVGPPAALLAVSAIVGLWVAKGYRAMTVAQVCVGLVCVGWLVSAAPRPPNQASSLDGGGVWFPGSTSVLVVRSDADDHLLDSLLRARIKEVDILVLESGNRRMSRLISELVQVLDARAIVAPTLHRVVGAQRLLSPLTVKFEDGAVLYIEAGMDKIETELVKQRPGPAEPAAEES